MAFFSSKIKFQPLTDALPPSPSSSLFQRLSLRSIKGIAMGFLLCIVLLYLVLWQPAYFRLRSLQEEAIYWQRELKLDITYTKSDIPTMDQLPEMIEQCRGAFEKEGVKVVDLNVERFGERRETGNEESLDYILVRLRLSGNWAGIVTSLTALEDTQVGNIHVQDVVLDAEGGEALLQVYFCTVEQK